VPTAVNWKKKVEPGPKTLEEKLAGPALEITLWEAESLLVQVTVVPARTVKLLGLKAKEAILTVADTPGTVVGVTELVVVVVWEVEQPKTKTQPIIRTKIKRFFMNIPFSLDFL
jgi:hypothetical protein